jgi:acetyl-CoA carboxylase carboxyl transferase subunit alpha
LEKLNTKLIRVRKEIFSSLTPWQRVEMARHPNRPYTNDYVKHLFSDWLEIHGDRKFADDQAIVSGIGKVCFIDTAGAYPGIGAEERGQALAIAQNIKEIAVIPVPIIVIITGEGGSGGALAIGIGDRVYMQEYSVYSVISPEGCASIIFRDQKYREEAAENLKITAEDLKKFKIIDGIIEEPAGGAHTDHQEAANFVGKTIIKTYNELKDIQKDILVNKRIEKFSQMGIYVE